MELDHLRAEVELATELLGAANLTGDREAINRAQQRAEEARQALGKETLAQMSPAQRAAFANTIAALGRESGTAHSSIKDSVGLFQMRPAQWSKSQQD